MNALARIHVLKKQAGLADEDYRDLLEGATGKSSAKEMTADERQHVIDKLVLLVGGKSGQDVRGPSKAQRASGPYAKKLQALWMALHDLGVVRDRHDSAMLAFVERQTKLSHIRFLRDPKDAAKAIEALKDMAARRGVKWLTEAQMREKGLKKAIADRHSVLWAQHAILEGALAGGSPVATSGEWQTLINELSAVERTLDSAPLKVLAEQLLNIQIRMGVFVRAAVAKAAS